MFMWNDATRQCAAQRRQKWEELVHHDYTTRSALMSRKSNLSLTWPSRNQTRAPYHQGTKTQRRTKKGFVSLRLGGEIPCQMHRKFVRCDSGLPAVWQSQSGRAGWPRFRHESSYHQANVNHKPCQTRYDSGLPAVQLKIHVFLLMAPTGFIVSLLQPIAVA